MVLNILNLSEYGRSFAKGVVLWGQESLPKNKEWGQGTQITSSPACSQDGVELSCCNSGNRVCANFTKSWLSYNINAREDGWMRKHPIVPRSL